MYKPPEGVGFAFGQGYQTNFHQGPSSAKQFSLKGQLYMEDRYHPIAY